MTKQTQQANDSLNDLFVNRELLTKVCVDIAIQAGVQQDAKTGFINAKRFACTFLQWSDAEWRGRKNSLIRRAVEHLPDVKTQGKQHMQPPAFVFYLLEADGRTQLLLHSPTFAAGINIGSKTKKFTNSQLAPGQSSSSSVVVGERENVVGEVGRFTTLQPCMGPSTLRSFFTGTTVIADIEYDIHLFVTMLKSMVGRAGGWSLVAGVELALSSVSHWCISPRLSKTAESTLSQMGYGLSGQVVFDLSACAFHLGCMLSRTEIESELWYTRQCMF